MALLVRDTLHQLRGFPRRDGTGKRFTSSVGMAACGVPPRSLLLRPLSGEKRTSNAHSEPFRF